LQTAVITAARGVAEREGVTFRMEREVGIDYSKALPHEQRLNHPLVQTAIAIANYFRKPDMSEVVAKDIGSTDANIAVSMGIPAVAIGAVTGGRPHQLEEYADAASIVPGIKSLVVLAIALASH
jgi:acetylornithine deacetylase/succinyl-diaminopimelate desuccinylase-like protein